MWKSNQEVCMCALDGTMDLLGKKWVLFTINAIGNHGSVRFKELYSELHGISPSTLSSILRQLESHGIVKRMSYAEIPPRVEYSLSENGLELRKAIIPLLVWASRQDGYSKMEKSCDPSQYIKVSF
ncbi:MAG: helix-turn-helix transcriptional regulator [Candidatus Marsarchaeota archaeon]|nr:helix-turn-helix transcriptional regulator [Candidatus Marsarchaeota archaeon]